MVCFLPTAQPSSVGSTRSTCQMRKSSLRDSPQPKRGKEVSLAWLHAATPDSRCGGDLGRGRRGGGAGGERQELEIRDNELSSERTST